MTEQEFIKSLLETVGEDEEIAIEIEFGPPRPERVAAYERFMSFYRAHVVNSVACQNSPDEERPRAVAEWFNDLKGGC